MKFWLVELPSDGPTRVLLILCSHSPTQIEVKLYKFPAGAEITWILSFGSGTHSGKASKPSAPLLVLS